MVRNDLASVIQGRKSTMIGVEGGSVGGNKDILRSTSITRKTRRHEFSGSEQLRHIGFRHATDIAVREGTTTSPFNDFADSLSLPCGNTSRGRQELVAERVEP